MAGNGQGTAHVIRRGTTPTVVIHVPDDITDMNAYVSFQTLCSTVTKAGADVTVEPDDEAGWTKVSTTLTQRDTLSFKSGETCEVQIRAEKRSGEVAVATKCGNLLVGKVLQDGVIG